jgi:acetylxylan esterase
MKSTIAAIAFAASAVAGPLGERATCPDIHVFGARETTAAAGYGSSSTVVNDILSGYPGSTAEAINYPACGGQSSCGGDSYSQSVAAGVSAAVTAVNNYVASCPSTQIVLVGYSQVSVISAR